MGYDPTPVLFTNLICADCAVTFNLWSTTGPSNICDACTMARSQALLAGIPLATDIFPIQDNQVSCGLRKDLPKKQRRHHFMSLGVDTRHYGELGDFIDLEVFACTQCGRDKVKKITTVGRDK